mmetsp:Transcript_7434/g.15524  ORF Transcript_7434/g.15524 Transcript_7434/m.15524 type:complete len:82 (+) Transcript_7434:52-297(+)
MARTAACLLPEMENGAAHQITNGHLGLAKWKKEIQDEEVGTKVSKKDEYSFFADQTRRCIKSLILGLVLYSLSSGVSRMVR